MYTPEALKDKIRAGAFDGTFRTLYGEDAAPAQRERYADAADAFARLFGGDREVRLFSAPGRTEVGGNHTDHQHGRVLAAGVNLDAVAVASPNQDGVIRIQSKGYPRDEVSLEDLEAREDERNHAIALIRGIAARFRGLGHQIGGFDAYTTSDVLGGSGLSSSAAFEVLVGSILSRMYNDARIGPVEIAKIAQYAENVYFGKPSGLMDQTASAVGGFVAIDFEDPQNPAVEKVDFDFARSGYSLCIVDTKGDHADLTPDYAAVPAEMKAVAALFGKEFLREIPPADFAARLGEIHGKVSDRALLRAMHFYSDNERVPMQVTALRKGDFDAFKEMVIASGRSSAMFLQNVFSPHDTQRQGLSLALAVSERLLKGKGAWRVHGGGFAGTIQAFVPNALLDKYRAATDGIFGEGSCRVLSVRPVGECEITGKVS